MRELLQLSEAVLTERERTIHVPLKELPPSLRAALKRVEYGSRDVGVVAQEKVEPNPYAGEGQKGFVLVVDIASGKARDLEGGWGGARPDEPREIDFANRPVPIPPGGAIIIGTQGWPQTMATIYVHPDSIAKMLPAMPEVTDREQMILRTIRSLTSAGRKEIFASEKVRPEEVDALVQRGLLSKTKAGAVSITTAGKNVAEGQEDAMERPIAEMASQRIYDALDRMLASGVDWGLPKGLKVSDEEVSGKDLRKGMKVAAVYKATNEGIDFVEILGVTGNDQKYGEGGAKYDSVAEACKAEGVRGVAGLEKKMEAADKERGYGHHFYLVLKDLDDGRTGAWYYPYQGRWARGSGAEPLTFFLLKPAVAESVGMRGLLRRLEEARGEELAEETAQVDTSVYEFSHGRKPRGFGSWAFSFNKKDVPHEEMFWVNQSTYGDALKQAKAEAKKRGAWVIYPQP